jgi:hypothetical protein
MSEKIYPIGGYAPGEYWHKGCKTCGQPFIGDKRAWNCELCGEKTAAAEMQMTLNDHDQIVANQVAGMPLEEAIFQSGFTRGHDVGYERGKREVQPSLVWVKATREIMRRSAILRDSVLPEQNIHQWIVNGWNDEGVSFTNRIFKEWWELEILSQSK